MTLKMHTGSCHCGAVRFEAEVDLAQGTVKCNCTSCIKARSWLVFTPADRFRLVAGADSQVNYQWAPPGQSASTVEFHFCKVCGIRTPARGEGEAFGGTVYAIQISLLDDVDPEELAAAPTQFLDGRHNRFDKQPSDVRFL